MTKLAKRIIELRATKRMTVGKIGALLGCSSAYASFVLRANSPTGKSDRLAKMVLKTCEECGLIREFLLSQNRRRRFCSMLCKRAFYKARCCLCKKVKEVTGDRSCRECNTERSREYRNTENGRAVSVRAVRRYEDRNKDRRPAWMMAQRIPRKPCVICGEVNSVRHHPDISRPLEVIMLCHFHHGLAHKGLSMVKYT